MPWRHRRSVYSELEKEMMTRRGYDCDVLRRLIEDATKPEQGFVHLVDYWSVVESVGLSETVKRLPMRPGSQVIEWNQFDITDFGKEMPCIALLDAIPNEEADRQVDFRYGFVGEEINRAAGRVLKGVMLSSILPEGGSDPIIEEYRRVLSDAEPSASIGRVIVRPYAWEGYLRLIHPVVRNEKVDRILLFMALTGAIRR